MQIRSLAFRQAVAPLILALCAALQASPAVAGEAPSQQVLDRVYAYNAGDVLNMHFGNALRPPDFTDQQASASLITTCTLTSVDGLWCLDGGLLRKWSNPLDLTGAPVNVLTCEDQALGIEATCTGMTVDKSGVIWLAGKKRSTSNKKQSSVYIVVKLTDNASCPVTREVNDLGPVYCAEEAYSGKYPITQLSPVDGDAAKPFQAGVLAIEDLKNVVFIPANGASPFLIPDSPQGNPKFGEVLDDVSFVVFNAQGYVIATTNSGHVLAKNVTTGGSVLKVFQIPSEREHGSKKCSNAKSQYAIRGAPTSSIVFVSDRQYCQVLALAPNANFTALENLPLPEGGGDFTLSTVDHDAPAAFPTFGLTVASGIGIDFSACVGGCTFINPESGNANSPNDYAAKLVDVNLVDDTKSGGTVFQMKNMPDCRYAASFPPQWSAKRTLCWSLPGVVVNPDPGHTPVVFNPDGTSNSTYPPASQLLNVRPLLPEDVTSAFDDSDSPPDGLPLQVLISPQYRGQEGNGYQFGALFVIPAKGVKYKGVFSGFYNVLALRGEPSLPEGEEDPRCVAQSDSLADLLAWNVTTAVSETYISVDGQYIDSLANTGCGSIRGSYGRLSFLPYDLEITPHTYGLTAKWWLGRKLTENNDAVFARLVESLIDDLDYAFDELACEAVDSANVPLPNSVCNHYSPARQKLTSLKARYDRCLVGAFTNKLLDDALPPFLRNRPYCALALAGLDQFRQELPDPEEVSPADYAKDIANRLGELHSRIDILEHVYTERFVPSIPDKGFCKELNSCAYPF